MSKRFKILDGALDYLRTSDNAPNPKAPTGTPLEEYQQWKSGERNVEYVRDNDSLPESLEIVAINPFGEEFSAANKYIVKISKRTQEFTTISPMRAAGNIVDTLPDNVVNVKGFSPAKCIVSVDDNTKDDDNAVSKLTGKKYVKEGKRSYTFPYGSGSTTDREAGVRNAILNAVPDDTNYGISFVSEKF